MLQARAAQQWSGRTQRYHSRSWCSFPRRPPIATWRANQTVTVTGEVQLTDTSNEVCRPGGNSPNYSANGAGGQGNYWMLDGVENLNIFVNSGPLAGAGTV